MTKFPFSVFCMLVLMNVSFGQTAEFKPRTEVDCGDVRNENVRVVSILKSEVSEREGKIQIELHWAASKCSKVLTTKQSKLNYVALMIPGDESLENLHSKTVLSKDKYLNITTISFSKFDLSQRKKLLMAVYHNFAFGAFYDVTLFRTPEGKLLLTF